MPEKGERDRWWDFLSGKPESAWNIPPLKKKGKAKLRHQHCENFVQGKMRAWDSEEHLSGDHEGNEDGLLDPEAQDQESARSDPETYDRATDKGEAKNSSNDRMPNSSFTLMETAASSGGAERVAECKLPAVAPKTDSEKESLTPREPSPKLLKHIDEVVPFYINVGHTSDYLFCVAHGITSAYVFQSLDQPLSSQSGIAHISPDNFTCSVDICPFTAG
jgi:hypothetical protein